MDKMKIPQEARNQQIVGQTGEAVSEDTSKLLLAIDGTEAGDKAFKYLMESKVSFGRCEREWGFFGSGGIGWGWERFEVVEGGAKQESWTPDLMYGG